MSEPSKPDNSFVQRMIKALAEIDRLITGAEQPSTPLALAPEVVVDKVRAYVDERERARETLHDYVQSRVGRHA